MMVAEIVADLTVLDILRRHLRQHPIPVEQLYRRRLPYRRATPRLK
jgi:hypothetical protein